MSTLPTLCITEKLEWVSCPAPLTFVFLTQAGASFCGKSVKFTSFAIRPLMNVISLGRNLEQHLLKLQL